ncbi:MAG: siphovirus ReqiPepy6 Gp37-like family protein [Bacteroidales bacterium]|nr:siphovirus ReqiPepy6 Gp37-like family protein [Bacteroidales bacterium]
MLLKDIEIHVYKLDNNTFDALGQINQFTSLIWPNKFNGYTTFELNVPLTDENKSLIKKGHIIWCGGDNAAMIEIIQSDTDNDGQKTYKVKGRTLEMLLTTRIIWGTYLCKGKYSSTAMYEIVDTQCVNPTQANRKIPFLECAEDEQLGRLISFQKTGDEIYDSLSNIATEAELGFSILFRPREKKLIFKVSEGIDRTLSLWSNNGSPLVVFSTDLEDILSSSYYTNNQDIKSTAYVAGEGEGTDRKFIISGDNASPGFLRRELYVDARDLQSEVSNNDGTTTTINEDDYRDMLNDRGKEKLGEYVSTESFEAKMRVVGDIQYRYGVDYFNGDKVLVQDTELGIQVIATISEVTENYDDEYELMITFGYEYPTLIQKIKKQMS